MLLIPPDELRAKSIWIAYRLVQDGDKTRKPPYSAKTGEAIGATLEYKDHWLSFDETLRGIEKFKLNGPGFVLSKEAGLVVIDFDHCRDPQTGEIDQTVVAWLRWFERTYQEVSPSGEGVHVVALGKIARAFKGPIRDDSKVTVEVYAFDRYITYTGNKIGDSDHVIDCQIGIDRLLKDRGSKPATPESQPPQSMSKRTARRLHQDNLNALRNAVHGTGNTLLNQTSFFAARAFAAKVFDESEAEIKQVIRDIVLRQWANPHPQPSADNTIDSGWRSGIDQPLDIKESDFPQIDETIEEFDKRFFKIRNHGGHPRVGEMKLRVVNRHYQYESLSTRSYRDFESAYRDDLIIIDHDEKKDEDEFRNKASVWLDKSRRVYEEVVYRPNQQVDPTIYNLWHGFAFEPKKGDNHKHWLDHVHDNVCGGNTSKFKVVLSWMADAVRYPERHANWAIAVRGKKGVGKNVFGEAFIRLWGDHGIVIAGEHALTKNFNAELLGKSGLLADEALFAMDRHQDRILKALITGEDIRIEQKGIDAFYVPNLLHIIIVGNDQKIVRATADERRYFALECGEKRIQDQIYFKRIIQGLNQGGYASLLYYLMNDVTVYELHNAPQTDHLKQQMSGEAVEELWVECLVSGRLPGRRNQDGTVNVILNDLVKKANRSRRRNWDAIKNDDVSSLLGKRDLDLTTSISIRVDKVKTRVWHIPTLAQSRENWNAKKYKREWPDDGGQWEGVDDVEDLF
jgi:hypothetical protein